MFEGGFLGLDNIGPIDRSAQLPVAGRLEQADGTAWMAMYCLNLLEIALVLAEHDRVYEDMATKFLEHFAYIASASRAGPVGRGRRLLLRRACTLATAARIPLRVRSMVGPPAAVATTTLGPATTGPAPRLRRAGCSGSRPTSPSLPAPVTRTHERDGVEGRLLSVVAPERLERILAVDARRGRVPLTPRPAGPVGRFHRDQPFSVDLAGMRFTVDYEPAESTTGLFGGNSNWRGPVWFPVNHLLIEAVAALSPASSATTSPSRCPTGSGRPTDARRGRRRPGRPAGRDLPRRRPGPAAGVRCRREAPDRPGAARPAPRSTSTSTATPAPGSARPTRPAGPASSPT